MSAEVYEIAKYIPVKLREKMAAQVYDKRSKTPSYNDTEGAGIRLCGTGRCPMGWLWMGHPSAEAEWAKIPLVSSIESRIRSLNPRLVKNVESETIQMAAHTFTVDWDTGRIKDLAAALGV